MSWISSPTCHLEIYVYPVDTYTHLHYFICLAQLSQTHMYEKLMIQGGMSKFLVDLEGREAPEQYPPGPEPCP